MARTTLNFSEGLSSEQVVARTNVHNSIWITALAELAEGVASGQGQVDTFYCLGTFENGTGARTTIRNIEKHVEAGNDLPGVFDLKSVVKVKLDDAGQPVTVTDDEGNTKQARVSELWACVVSPEAQAAAAAAAEAEATQDSETSDTEDETDDAPRSRRRSA